MKSKNKYLDYKKIVTLFLSSNIISCNNILQMIFLKDRELINDLALWEASSVILLCIYYLVLFYNTYGIDNKVFKFSSIKQIRQYYIDIILKFISAGWAILYILKLSNLSMDVIFYMIQGVLIILDVIIQIYLIKYYKSILNSDEKNLKSYQKEIEYIPCTSNDLEAVSTSANYSLIGILICIVYMFFVQLNNTDAICTFMLCVNMSLIYIINSKIKLNLQINNIKILDKKQYIKCIILMVITNIVNCFIGIYLDNIKIRLLFTTIVSFYSLFYILLKLIIPISNVLNRMQLYLEKNKDGQSF